MKKTDVLEFATHDQIIKMCYKEDMIDEVKMHVDPFYQYNQNLPQFIKNAVLIRAISATQANNETFSKAYLDAILRTFDDYKVNTVEQAVKFLENKHNHSGKRKPGKLSDETMMMVDEQLNLLESRT